MVLTLVFGGMKTARITLPIPPIQIVDKLVPKRPATTHPVDFFCIYAKMATILKLYRMLVDLSLRIPEWEFDRFQHWPALKRLRDRNRSCTIPEWPSENSCFKKYILL